MTTPEIIISCRRSDLAVVQAENIKTILSTPPTPHTFRIVTGTAAADTDKVSPFAALLSKQAGGSDAGKSLWTNDLERDLVAGRAHVLVHCLKDMPTTLPAGCALAAVTEREDPSDAVVMRQGAVWKTIGELPTGSVVGSSSSRRRALVKRNWPHLEVAECRGNLDTRIAKLDAPDSPFACILLATAGLNRLNLSHRITQHLTPDEFPWAVGQGALGIEVVSEGQEDITTLALRADHVATRWMCLAERAMLRKLQGGCSSPVGVWTSMEEGKVKLRATVLNIEGTKDVVVEEEDVVEGDEGAEGLGERVAEGLLKKGARDLLEKK
ncbi:porphobilinogen deaminase [Plectosphaerella plurivora]|uniref:hydroxymethylbilane synthase n=1 Tax=Plectosphaerella plurivora TaxID=936078 RepID=A0A9P8V8E5_9PEZI|nr:porphobilinogen deaminase [Plectosphaerella plurivora]